MSEILSPDALEAGLAELPGWSLRDGKLHRRFEFADFAEAFGFMAAAALRAERADHHPEWSNVYRVVEVDLTTHEAGGVTDKDLALAAEMSALANA